MSNQASICDRPPQDLLATQDSFATQEPGTTVGCPEDEAPSNRSRVVRVGVIARSRESLHFIEQQLVSAGYQELCSVSTTADGLALVRMTKPDVLLLDFPACGHGAADVVSAIKADPMIGLTPVVAIVGPSEPECAAAFAADIDEVISTNLHPCELRMRFGKLVALRTLLKKEQVASTQTSMQLRQRAIELQSICVDLVNHLDR